MATTIAVIALLAGLFFGYKALTGPKDFELSLGKNRPSQSVDLIIYDGATMYKVRAKRVPEGLSYNNVIYEQSMLVPILSNGQTAFFCGADRVALAQHQALEQARVRILKGRVFKPGGDIVDMLRMAGAILIVVVGVVVWIQQREVVSGMAAVQARLKVVEETLGRPLNIIPVQPAQQPTQPQP